MHASACPQMHAEALLASIHTRPFRSWQSFSSERCGRALWRFARQGTPWHAVPFSPSITSPLWLGGTPCIARTISFCTAADADAAAAGIVQEKDYRAIREKKERNIV